MLEPNVSCCYIFSCLFRHVLPAASTPICIAQINCAQMHAEFLTTNCTSRTITTITKITQAACTQINTAIIRNQQLLAFERQLFRRPILDDDPLRWWSTSSESTLTTALAHIIW